MNKEIFKLALPNILSNLSIPLLGIVDIALVGRLSEIHIGAVGLGGIIFSFLYWNFGFLRIGTTGITAQSYGAQNKELSRITLMRSAILAGVTGVLLLLFQYPVIQIGNLLLNTPEESKELVKSYFHIRIWDAPAVLLLFACNGWYFGMQNTWLPMIITIVINVANIIFSYLFVFHFKLDIEGVAYGTVLSQYLGIFLYIIIIVRKHGIPFLYADKGTLFERKEFIRFMKINVDFFLRNISLTVAFGYFYRQSAAMGSLSLAVNTILLQYVNLMSYGIDGFAHAAESLVGKYKGALNSSELKKAVRYCLLWGGLTAAIYASVYWLGGETLLKVFTDDRRIISEAVQYLHWMIVIPFMGFFCYLWDGVFGGLTASREMRNSMLVALLFFILSFQFLGEIWQNNGLWLGFSLFLGVRGIGQSWLFYRKREKLIYS